jgi:hypothetical protein
MPQFTRQGSRPLTAAAYERAAAKAQDLAENVAILARQAHSEDASVRTKQRLTQAIHSLSMHCRRLSERHRGMSYAQVVAEEDRQ